MFSRYSLAKKFSIRWSIYYIWRYVRYVKINDKCDYHSIDILFESMFLEEGRGTIFFPIFLLLNYGTRYDLEESRYRLKLKS